MGDHCLVRYGFNPRMFHDTLSELLDSGRLPGKLQGSASKATYAPDLQQKTQDRWIGSFYKSNQYIEFDAVQKLGIKQPGTAIMVVHPHPNFCTNLPPSHSVFSLSCCEESCPLPWQRAFMCKGASLVLSV